MHGKGSGQLPLAYLLKCSDQDLLFHVPKTIQADTRAGSHLCNNIVHLPFIPKLLFVDPDKSGNVPGCGQIECGQLSGRFCQERLHLLPGQVTGHLIGKIISTDIEYKGKEDDMCNKALQAGSQFGDKGTKYIGLHDTVSTILRTFARFQR